MRGRRSPVALAAVAALAGGCGSGDDGGGAGSERPAAAMRADRKTAEPRRDGGPSPATRPASCPPGLAGCEVASGRILYVERVDPDGDGDAHFVLISDESVTAPGISVIDVRADLRPSPLPGPGEYLSGAGPVRVGSYGQRQIEAVAVEVAHDRLRPG